MKTRERGTRRSRKEGRKEGSTELLAIFQGISAPSDRNERPPPLFPTHLSRFFSLLHRPSAGNSNSRRQDRILRTLKRSWGSKCEKKFDESDGGVGEIEPARYSTRPLLERIPRNRMSPIVSRSFAPLGERLNHGQKGGERKRSKGGIWSVPGHFPFSVSANLGRMRARNRTAARCEERTVNTYFM